MRLPVLEETLPGSGGITMTSDESFMKQAVKQAKKAYDKLETPIGCVIVHEDKIIARGYNKRNMRRKEICN